MARSKGSAILADAGFGDYFATAVSSDGRAVPVVSVALAPTTTFEQAINSARLAIVTGTFGTREAAGSASSAAADVSADVSHVDHRRR